MWKTNKQRIEFFNGEPSITENFPIIESKDLKLKWVKGVREDFQKCVKKGESNIPSWTHLSRCPGIFDLFKDGYVILLHKDIIIKPKEEDFEFIVANDTLHSPFGITHQSTELIAKPPWAANFIIKINTGWHVIAPKSVKFLMLPIAYPDTFDFTATAGVLDPAISTEVNFQLFWNATETETLIQAGTPMVQLIPLTEKKYQWVQRIMNQQDRDWVEKLNTAYGSTFWPHTVRSKVVDMYNKYWK